MRVNILLHDFSRHKPFGGIKQQYELANRLAEIGYDVAIYHSLNFAGRDFVRPRSMAGLVSHNSGGRAKLKWFALSAGVRCQYIPRISPRLLRRSDVTIISSARVAEQMPARTDRLGRLLYVVYEYPVWRHGSPELKQALTRALQRDDIEYIACSSVVEEMLLKVGAHPVAKITCGIDLPDQTEVPATDGRTPIVGFALRPEAHKGVQTMLEAIRSVSTALPSARFECFGREANNFAIPHGVHVHGYLDDERLGRFYRSCMVFVSPSYAEGWGLTAAEAMANGAAVVVTDDGGSRDFAIDGDTAIVIPPRDPDAIASAVARLLRDESLRTRIVEHGLKKSGEMSWKQVVAKFDAVLSGRVEPGPLGGMPFPTAPNS